VNKAKQVLIVRDGKVVHISPVSTAGLPAVPPSASSRSTARCRYDPSPLGILYKPMYFTSGYATTEPVSASIPASQLHPGAELLIERHHDSEPYGETVYV
jgi:hypothetical protein